MRPGRLISPIMSGAGWIVLDVLAGLVPIIVDAATGAWYGLDQDNVNAVLEKQQK